MTSGLPDLTASQAATRLGIKPETLYAYVSRGLLHRRKGPGGSRFDALEVEAFARSRRPAARSTASTTAHSSGSPLMTIEHDIALLEDDHLYFRGRDATELSDVAEFETVCWWLWTGAWEPDRRFEPSPAGLDVAPRVRAALPTMSLREQMQVQVTVLGSLDPLRHDLSPGSVARIGAEIIAGVVTALPLVGPPPPKRDRALPARLWPRVSRRRPRRDDLRLIRAMLILLADHDLAASTLAVRAAASARAHPYAVVACGLGALDSALHGNAGRDAYAMIARVLAGAPAEEAVAGVVASRGGVPGFGHRVYRRSDPRWEHIVGLLGELVGGSEPLRASLAIVSLVQSRMPTFPNVDLALATVAHTLELEPDATELIFALARCAGWLAHALAEYAEAPLRLRPEGRYVGP